MTFEERSARADRLCADCSCALERSPAGEWFLSRCPRCGGVWIDGAVLRQMFRHLRLRHFDSKRAEREMGNLLISNLRTAIELGGPRHGELRKGGTP